MNHCLLASPATARPLITAEIVVALASGGRNGEARGERQSTRKPRLLKIGAGDVVVVTDLTATHAREEASASSASGADAVSLFVVDPLHFKSRV